MKLEKTGETKKTVVFQSDCTQQEINQAVQQLILRSPKDPFYVFKNPSFLFKSINYAGVRIKKEYIYIPSSITTPPIYIEFNFMPDGKPDLTFRVSYLPVMRWAFYLIVPLTIYFLYQALKTENRLSVILSVVGFGVLMCAFFALIAFFHEKMIHYFFKRDVNRIVRDLAP